jgi:hypothetical protein
MHTRASIDVVDERVRQLIAEEWDYAHDDQYTDGELAEAAVCYAIAEKEDIEPPFTWPWGADDWKPKSYRENLVRSAALLIAEIERIDRLEEECTKKLEREQD